MIIRMQRVKDWTFSIRQIVIMFFLIRGHLGSDYKSCRSMIVFNQALQTLSTLSVATFRIMTLSLRTVRRNLCGIMKVSITELSITKLRITAFGVATLGVMALKYNNTKQNDSWNSQNKPNHIHHNDI